MKILEDGIEFSSGRSVYINQDIIGITSDGELFHGYDGSIDYPPFHEYQTQLSKEDMLELADEMIKRWTKFKESL